MTDSILGRSIKAFVVAHEGQKIDRDDLIAYSLSACRITMVPKTIQILDDLPRAASGKADYPALSRREGP